MEFVVKETSPEVKSPAPAQVQLPVPAEITQQPPKEEKSKKPRPPKTQKQLDAFKKCVEARKAKVQLKKQMKQQAPRRRPATVYEEEEYDEDIDAIDDDFDEEEDEYYEPPRPKPKPKIRRPTHYYYDDEDEDEGVMDEYEHDNYQYRKPIFFDDIPVVGPIKVRGRSNPYADDGDGAPPTPVPPQAPIAPVYKPSIIAPSSGRFVERDDVPIRRVNIFRDY